MHGYTCGPAPTSLKETSKAATSVTAQSKGGSGREHCHNPLQGHHPTSKCNGQQLHAHTQTHTHIHKHAHTNNTHTQAHTHREREREAPLSSSPCRLSSQIVWMSSSAVDTWYCISLCQGECGVSQMPSWDFETLPVISLHER